jgi:hypothetical protein
VRPPDAHVAGPDQFFYPELTGADQLRQEVFALGYHLHWSWSEAMGLEVDERRAYLLLLSGVLAEQQAEMERANNARR